MSPQQVTLSRQFETTVGREFCQNCHVPPLLRHSDTPKDTSLSQLLCCRHFCVSRKYRLVIFSGKKMSFLIIPTYTEDTFYRPQTVGALTLGRVSPLSVKRTYRNDFLRLIKCEY